MATLILGAEVETARIPELPPKSLALSVNDLIPYYVLSENKTRKITVQALLDFMTTGGVVTSHPPVTTGGEYVYVVPDGIAPGTTDANLPGFAGMDFTLERGGPPMIALLEDLSNADIAEYEILDAGGFRLLRVGDELHEKERFKLIFYQLFAGGPVTTGSSSYIKGKKVVTTNVTLDVATDFNKIIQLRALATQVTITIPSVLDIPENSWTLIESSINNSKENLITTSGGQSIYFNNAGLTTIGIRPGEVVKLFRDEDGLYVINDFYRNYTDIGKPFAGYKIGLNELLCKGQELNRADYPRLWAYIQTLGSSLVSDATWLTASVVVGGHTVLLPYRGCFSTGDGSTTFRMPDLMNMFLRGIKSDSGSDTERTLNKAGGYQDDTMEKFWPGTPTKPVIIQVDGTNTVISRDADGTLTQPNIVVPIVIDKNLFSIETRPENVGVLYLMKV